MTSPTARLELEVPAAAPVRHLCTLLRQRTARPETRAGVLLGCGNGNEVAYLRQALGSSRVVGLDVSADFSSLARAHANLLVANAERLPFPSESFDFAAAIHSLEHMTNPHTILAEVRRVLRPGAWFYVGVPNRTRLLGYVGSSEATAWQKVAWNLIDYAKRIRGRFRNELGAHAGFSARELRGLLEGYFTEIQLITEDYVRFKYAGRLPRRILDFLLAPSVMNYSAPAHYALCRKE